MTVTVNLWSGLRRFTDGAVTVEVEAKTIGQMLDALVDTHPALGPLIEDGVSVAIDGEVIAISRNVPVSETSEIYLLQQLKGG